MLNNEDLKWLESPVKSFIRNLDVINDPAERTVKLAQDFIKHGKSKEGDLQNEFLLVADHRKKVKGDKKGHMKKAELKNI